MRTYSSGQYLDFQVIDKEKIREKYYFRLSDNYLDTFRVEAFDFQLEDDISIIGILNCFIKKVNHHGLPILEQNKLNIFEQFYSEFGEMYVFSVVAKHVDKNTGRDYFELNDNYGIYHRYYLPDNTKFKGDETEINLIVKDFDDNGDNKIYLVLEESSYKQIVNPKAEAVKKAKAIEEETFKAQEISSFGRENEKLEFKSTIVFVPGRIEPDVDEQLKKIIQTIASFMNRDGGQLLVGVNDQGVVTGIRDDFKHLDSGLYDPGTYQLNEDGFENKIRNGIAHYLGQTANQLTTIQFKVINNIQYCQVDIEKAPKPIYFGNYKIYVRIGNSSRCLTKDEITDFVQAKLNFIPSNKLEADRKDIRTGEETNTDSSVKVEPIKPLPIDQDNRREPLDVWYRITLYQNGEWSFQKNKSNAEDVLWEIPIYKTMKSEHVFMVYSNGRINAVVPSKIFKTGRGKLKTKGKRYKNGWNTDQELLSVFSIKKRDLFSVYMEDENQIKWAKCHNAEAISTHGNLHSQGNIVVNEKYGVKLLKVFKVDDAYRKDLTSITLKDHQTSNYIGYRHNNQRLHNSFRVLEKIERDTFNITI